MLSNRYLDQIMRPNCRRLSFIHIVSFVLRLDPKNVSNKLYNIFYRNVTRSSEHSFLVENLYIVEKLNKMNTSKALLQEFKKQKKKNCNFFLQH